MVSARPMLVVNDVSGASTWFQDTIGLTSGHGGDEYEELYSGSDLLVQLHHWDQDEHPHLGRKDDPSRGNGVVVWFGTDDFDGALERATDAGADVLDGPLVNPFSGDRELWLRGPDGYVVAIQGPPA